MCLCAQRGVPVRTQRTRARWADHQQTHRHQAPGPVRERSICRWGGRPERCAGVLGGPVQTERGFVLHEPMQAQGEQGRKNPPMPPPWSSGRRAGDDHLQRRAEAPGHGRRAPACADHAGLFGLGRGSAGIRTGREHLADRGRRPGVVFDTPSTSATTARSACWACRRADLARGGTHA